MTDNGGGGGGDDGAAASSSRNDDDGEPEGGGAAGSSIASQSSSSSSSSNDDNRVNNNFENYLKLRMKYVFGDDGDSSRDAATTGGGEETMGRHNYNHFTTPLVDPTTTRERLPTSSSSPPPPTTDDGTDPAASPFSDLERSHVVDGFFDVFAEKMGDAVSSGRLSRAWQQQRPDGGGGGLFSRRWWPWKEYNSPSPDGGRTDRRRSKIEPNDYAAERAMITPHLTPLIWGSCCALLTLSSLRLGRWYRGRRALHTGSGGGGGGGGNDAKRGGGNHVERWHNETLASRNGIAIGNNARRSSTNGGNGGGGGDTIITSLGTVLVDASLSMLFGINAAVFLSRPDRLMADFAAAPLLGGESALAEELCGPFSDEMDAVNGRATTTTMRRARGGDADGGGGGDAAEEEEEEEEGAVVVPYSELWKDENLGGYGSLRAVRDFVANCREREEKNIRVGKGRRRERREGAVGDDFSR